MFGAPPVPLVPDLRAPEVPLARDVDLARYAQQIVVFLQAVHRALAHAAS